MQTDHYGNRLCTTSEAAVAAYDHGVALFLAAEFGAEAAFAAAVAADPAFALGHAALARARMMAADMPGARAAIAAATANLPAHDPRVHSHVAAFSALLAGQPAQARALVYDHVRDWPRDALIAQMCTNVFGLIGFSGEVGREAALLSFTGMLLPHYPDDWWMMSMHALSLCETGQATASLNLMERALALNPRNANGAHFKAHALYEMGEAVQGRAYLDDWIAGYDPRAVLHGHLSWHAALWALQDGDADSMWRIVDTSIAPGATQSLPVNVLTDMAAICFRAELAGFAVAPDRWARLSDYAARYFPSTGQSFADMHAALAHARVGEGDRLAHIAESAQGFAGDLVRPVARAWAAMARQNWAEARDDLLPVMAQSERIGGSRAQRDLIELAYVSVLLRLGQTDEARRTLALRRPDLATPVPLAGFAGRAA